MSPRHVLVDHHTAATIANAYYGFPLPPHLSRLLAMSSSLSSIDPAHTTATSTPLVLTTSNTNTPHSVASLPFSPSASSTLAADAPRPPSLTPFDHLISGLTAGSVSTLLLHPFDLIKTRLQASPTTQPAIPLPPSTSSIALLRAIVRDEGVRALWKGISPNFIGNTIAWGSYFFLYNSFKQRYQQLTRRQQLSAVDYLACAALSGTCVAALTNPVWVVKTRMFLDARTMAESEQRLLPALGRLWREEGVRGLYRGFVPSVLGVSHGAVQFMTYEMAKQRLLDYKRRANAAASSVSFTPLDTVGLAIASKVTAAVTTYPYQVIRTQLQDKRVQPPLRGTWDAVKHVWAAGGVRGLYRGVMVGTLKVIPSACVVFVVYEETEKLLKRRAMVRQVGQHQQQQQLAQQYVSDSHIR